MTLIDKLILKEYKKLKEDDAGIRSTLDSLDYTEKGSEIVKIKAFVQPDPNAPAKKAGTTSINSVGKK